MDRIRALPAGVAAIQLQVNGRTYRALSDRLTNGERKTVRSISRSGHLVTTAEAKRR